MAQPPGRETTASPKRASMGPRTRIDARIDLTSSYGANSSRIVAQSTSMFMRSSTTSSTPMRPSSSMVVVMSCRWGMFPTLTGPSASRVAARIGNAAFFAPEMRISPSSGTPPLMMSLSIRPGSGAPMLHGCHCETALSPDRSATPGCRGAGRPGIPGSRGSLGTVRPVGTACPVDTGVSPARTEGPGPKAREIAMRAGTSQGGSPGHRPSCSHCSGVYMRSASA